MLVGKRKLDRMKENGKKYRLGIACPQKNPRHRGGTFLGFGCCETWTEVWCLVAVPELVAADLFVGSDVVAEFGLGVVSVFVVQHAMSLFFFAWNCCFWVITECSGGSLYFTAPNTAAAGGFCDKLKM